MNKIAAALAIPGLGAFLGCTEPCQSARYCFSTPVNWTVENPTDTISVGDTLWIYAEFADQFYDTISGKPVHYPNADILGQTTGIWRFKERPSKEKGQNEYFEIAFIDSGTPEKNMLNLVLDKGSSNWEDPIYVNNKYIYRLGLVPKYRGSYYYSSVFVTGTKAMEGKCGTEDAKFLVSELEPASRQNLKKFSDHYGIPASFYVSQNYDFPARSKSAYCFVVK